MLIYTLYLLYSSEKKMNQRATCHWCNKRFRTFKAENYHTCLIWEVMTEAEKDRHSDRLIMAATAVFREVEE